MRPLPSQKQRQVAWANRYQGPPLRQLFPPFTLTYTAPDVGINVSVSDLIASLSSYRNTESTTEPLTRTELDVAMWEMER